MRLLILDRDGVINNESSAFIKSPEEWIPIAGSLEAIARACTSGFRVVVVSNQSGLARGLFNIGDLNRIHKRMLSEVSRVGGHIEAIFFCPHAPEADCQCRKPRPGLFYDLQQRLGVDLSSTIVIGDRASDLDAAAAVGAQKILVKTGHGQSTLSNLKNLADVIVCDNLSDAVDYLATEN